MYMFLAVGHAQPQFNVCEYVCMYLFMYVQKPRQKFSETDFVTRK